MQDYVQRQGPPSHDDEFSRLEKQLSRGNHILHTLTSHNAYIDELKYILKQASQQIQQIANSQENAAPGSNPSENQDESQTVYDQIYSNIRTIINNIPQTEEIRDIFPKLHQHFSEILLLKTQAQVARLQHFQPPQDPITEVQNKKFDFGIDHADRDKCEEISSSFKISQNAVSSKRSKLIDSLVPSKQALSYIEQNIDMENPIESLNEIYNDLCRTEKELTKELNSLDSNSVLYRDYINNPPFDLIRESPEYQEYFRGSQFILPKVRSKAEKMQTIYTQMLNKHQELTEALVKTDFNPCDEDWTKFLADDADVQVLSRKLHFIKGIVGNLRSIFPEKSADFCKHDRDVMSKALNSIDKNDIESFKKIIKEYQSELPSIQKGIEEETSQIDSYSMNLEQQLPQLMRRHTKQQDQGSIRALETARENVRRNKQVIEQAEEQMNIQFKQLKQKHTDLMSQNFSIKAFPPSLDVIFENTASKRAVLSWYKRRIQSLENENAEVRKRINSLNEEAENLANETKMRGEMVEQMSKMKTKSIPYSLKELKSIVECPLCGKQRDTVLLSCGHTFCSNCAKGFVRNRNCPACDTRFTQFDIKQFSLE